MRCATEIEIDISTIQQPMDKHSSSSEDADTDRVIVSSPLTLPQIRATNAFVLPPSIMEIAEKKKRTIKTDFGTIIIDDGGIRVQSDGNQSCSLTPQAGPPSQSASRTPDCPCAFPMPKHNERYGGSRMILFNAAKTSSRVLASAAERQRRLERGVWSSDTELLLVACSSLVGLGTVILTPQLWLQNGGAAFMLMYSVCLLLLGVPLLLLEAALGQFCAHSMAELMPQMAPALKGYSYALVLSLLVTTAAYMPDVSSAVVYGVEAARQKQPWMGCDGSYNSPLCYTHALDHDCQRHGALLYVTKRCVPEHELCSPAANETALRKLATACVVHHNRTVSVNMTMLRKLRVLAGDEFFSHVPHTVEPTLDKLHAPILSSLLACWLVTALVTQAGVTGLRYTLPFVIGVPLVIIFTLTVNVMLFYPTFFKVWRHLIPDVEKLGNLRGWLLAAKYSLYSLGIGSGMNAFIYSRNMLTHDCKRSAITIAVMKLAIGAFCVLSYTCILGKHALDVDMEVSELIAENWNKHALVLLTSSLGLLNASQAWSVLLLLATVLVGIGTVQIALLTIEASLRELGLLDGFSTRAVIFLLCMAFFLLDAVCTIPSSYYAQLSIHHYATIYYCVVMTFALVVAVNVVLGVDRLLDDLHDTMAVPMKWSRNYWRVSWRYVCPAILLGLFLGTIVDQAQVPLQHAGDSLPVWTVALGGVLVVCPLLLLVGVVFRVYQKNERFDTRLDLFVPTRRWRPGLLNADASAPDAPSAMLTGKSSSQFLMSSVPSLMTQIYSTISSRQLTALPEDDQQPGLTARQSLVSQPSQ